MEITESLPDFGRNIGRVTRRLADGDGAVDVDRRRRDSDVAAIDLLTRGAPTRAFVVRRIRVPGRGETVCHRLYGIVRELVITELTIGVGDEVSATSKAACRPDRLNTGTDQDKGLVVWLYVTCVAVECLIYV